MFRQIAPLFLGLSLFSAGICANPATVAESLDARIVEQKPGGKVLLRAAYRARPGDVVEYQATYTNTGSKSVQGVVATLPVPVGSEYVLASAQPREVLASLDGKSFAPVPLRRATPKLDGGQQLLPVQVADYRYLRWYIEMLAPGESAVVTARMQVVAEPENIVALLSE